MKQKTQKQVTIDTVAEYISNLLTICVTQYCSTCSIREICKLFEGITGYSLYRVFTLCESLHVNEIKKVLLKHFDTETLINFYISATKLSSKLSKSVSVEEGDVFDTGLEVYDIEHGCPFAKKYVIKIPPEIWFKIKKLVEIMNDHEFAVIFPEYEEHDNVIYVKSMYIPKQEVTHSNVDVKETLRTDVGYLHYHPMTTSTPSFSSIDNDNLLRNFKFNIVVSKSMKYEAKVKVKLPCGIFALVPADVEIDVKVDVESLKKEVEKKIKKTVSVTSYSYQYPQYRSPYNELEWEYERWYEV